jgi:uncharacterized protein (TIGR01370 family)
MLVLICLLTISSISQSQKIEHIKKYAVCYAKITPQETSGFELLILEPDLYTKDEILDFKKRGVKAIAYLNIAELETYRNHSLPESIIVGKNPLWEDHFYVDINSRMWEDYIFFDRIPKIISKEFDGFFIDMVDIVSVFPNFKDKIIDYIKRIKIQNDDKILIINNGWVLLDTLKSFADAFLIEGLFTRYNFKTKRYFVRFEREYKDRVETLKKLGKKIFTLDFLPENDKRKYFIKSLSLQNGFTPYISTIELNKIYR